MAEKKTMQAAWFEAFGEAKDVLKVGELEKPVPDTGEVLVRLHASGINPSDVKKRAGSFPGLLDDGLIIPNSDGAGIIEAVGNGVDKSRIGERVWVYQAQFARRFGTAAQYVAIEESRAPRLSEKAGFDTGACLGIPVMTAHRAVFADGAVEDRTVLVTGGAGRVGYYAIQWASQAGARVIATASNEEDYEACLAAGADAVVDHRSESLTEEILETTGGHPVDRIVEVEFGANLQTAIDVIRVGGTIATYSSTVVPEPQLPFFQMMYKDLTIRIIIVYAMPEPAKRQAIADIGSALDAGRLTHRVARRLPLGEIAVGNELVEEGNIRGCVVLDID